MADSDWFFPIVKLRGIFEIANKGTVFGGPVGTVAPLADKLGGDKTWWPALQASVAVSNPAFFELLHAKAHFLMLPKTIVTALEENTNVRLSEDQPPGPFGGADTVMGDSPRSAWMHIPGASAALVGAGYDLGRDNTPISYRMLARIYHEMTHAMLWLHEDYDDEFQTLWSNGVVAYLHATGVNGSDFSLEPDNAFSEAAPSYVGDRIHRWCKALHDLDVLLRNKPEDREEVQMKVQFIVDDYDRDVRTYGKVEIEKDGIEVIDTIASPELSVELRNGLNKKVLDSCPCTKPFADTPLAGLRTTLLPP